MNFESYKLPAEVVVVPDQDDDEGIPELTFEQFNLLLTHAYVPKSLRTTDAQ